MNVLFLCTGNSARSILAEALLNHHGQGRFRAFSAGSHPKGRVHPTALEILRFMGLPTRDLRSKSWDEFATAEAAQMDIIITVCDNAAAEACPVWPGQPVTAHWGIPDPAAAGDPAQQWLAFEQAYAALETRIRTLVNLPQGALSPRQLQKELDDIGRMPHPGL